jgi:hypothetical protein
MVAVNEEETAMKRMILLAALILVAVTGTTIVTSLIGTPPAMADPDGNGGGVTRCSGSDC